MKEVLFHGRIGKCQNMTMFRVVDDGKEGNEFSVYLSDNDAANLKKTHGSFKTITEALKAVHVAAKNIGGSCVIKSNKLSASYNPSQPVLDTLLSLGCYRE